MAEKQDNNKNNKNNNNPAKNQVRNAIKRIAISIGIKVAIVLIPIIIIMVLLSAITWFLSIEEGTWKDEKGNPSTYTKTAQATLQDGISVDKEKLINQSLLDMGFTEEEIANFTEAEIIDIFDVEEKLGKTITKLTDLTHAEILWCTNDVYPKYLKKPEDLQKLLDVELITQYPKIEGLAPDKLNGIVEFVRYTTDPDTQQEQAITLKWISNDEFEEKMERYELMGNTDVLNFFTLDENGNIKIATWKREEGDFYSNNTTWQTNRKKIRAGITGEEITAYYDSRYVVDKDDSSSIEASFVDYTIEEQTINYKMMVQKYTLPFEYLWAFLVMTKSDQFVLSLADLAYDSEIKIGIYDNIDKVVSTNTEKYREEFRERYVEYLKGNHTPIKERPSHDGWDTEGYDYEIRNTITTYTDNIQCEIMHADVWIVEVMINYKNTIEQQPINTNKNSVPDEDWDNDISTNEWEALPPYSHVQGTTGTSKVPYISYTYTGRKTINHQYESSTETTLSKYERIPPSKPRAKVDKDPNADPNFVNLAFQDTNVYRVLSNMGSVSWLLDIIERNADTANMVDVTRHLIYLVTGNETYNMNFDFSYYESELSFSSITNPIYGGTIQEKVWFALKDLGLSDIAVAGAMGNIHHESGSFDPTRVEGGYDEFNGGIGICQWTNYPRDSGKGRNAQLRAYAASKGKTWQDEDTQVEFLVAELTNGNGFAEKQLITSKSYYDGVKHSPSEWKDADNIETATKVFCYCFERPSAEAASSSMQNRIDKAIMYLNQFSGKEKPTGSNEDYINADKVSVMGYTFPHYYQRNYAYRRFGAPGKTISSSGCGPTSMAMIVAGLTNKPNVNPDSFVTALESYFPNYNSYYTNGVGSNYAGLCNSQFLQIYYKLKSRMYPTYSETITALSEGKCAIARIEGHVLALVPVTEEQRQQGYVFYVMDSASGLDGPYRNQEELRKMVDIKRPGRGFGFSVKAIIEPM